MCLIIWNVIYCDYIMTLLMGGFNNGYEIMNTAKKHKLFL